jgi:hypothetical protein
MKRYVLPIENSGKGRIGIEIEPEGDWFPLEAGERCELRLLIPENQELDLELEIQDELILLHCSATKEVWKNGRQLR